MAKEANAAEAVNAPQATVTMDQLLPLLEAITSKSTAAAEVQARILGEKMVEGLIAANKPYLDPKKEENEEKFREQMRRQAKAERENLKAARNNCPHIAGSNPLSEFQDQYGRTCIVWHQSPSSEWVGTCLQCQRQFFENDPDYNEWRRKPSICRVSGSGQYQFLDPAAARARARGEVAA